MIGSRMRRTNSYRNGNTLVAICADGTKLRYTPDGVNPAPEFPESIDLKITGYCEENCPMCHENAGKDGIHGNLEHPLLDTIQPYTELAIGGGNPLTHPGLYEFLQRMRDRKVICNLTVHWNQFVKEYEMLRLWQEDGLLHGIGVSIGNQPVQTELLCGFPNLVVHTIAGINDENCFRNLADNDLNLLILGYKDYGRGIHYYRQNPDVDGKIRWVADHVASLSDHFRSVSFDNLAIKQLDLRSKLSAYFWDRFYMGGEGEFTMYVDLVENKFAASSTDKRMDICSDDIRDLFRIVNKR